MCVLCFTLLLVLFTAVLFPTPRQKRVHTLRILGSLFSSIASHVLLCYSRWSHVVLRKSAMSSPFNEVTASSVAHPV